MTWQPIESAPKDGTRIRLGNKRDASSMKVHSIRATTGEWDGKRWCVSSFFIVPGGRHGLLSGEPTHWMPLPLPSARKENTDA